MAKIQLEGNAKNQGFEANLECSGATVLEIDDGLARPGYEVRKGAYQDSNQTVVVQQLECLDRFDHQQLHEREWVKRQLCRIFGSFRIVEQQCQAAPSRAEKNDQS
jgi:hypothetical protein